jgi:hypothetical protein
VTEQPWLSRPDWASGRIEDGSRAAAVAAWLFAGLWNLISTPAAYFAGRQALREGNKAALVGLLFPVVGIGLVVWAVRATLRYRRYGVSRLDLATVPAPVGRELRGTVVAPAVLETREELRVTLTCVRRVTRGAGKNRSTTETVLWQEEQRVAASHSRTAEGMVTAIPVAFRIPGDVEPSDGTDPRNKVVWRLEVSAGVPGVDYRSAFEVPVFRTSEDVVPADPGSPAAAVRPFVQPATSRIKVSRSRRGTEIDFPAGRNPGAAAGLTALLAVWLVATWATIRFEAPVLIQVIFAAFGFLFAWASAALWFGASRVTIGDGSVTVARGLFAPMREQRMGIADIARVTTRIGMQAGRTPYYDLMLIRNDGRKLPAGRAIRDKREAEWLADTVREALRR